MNRIVGAMAALAVALVAGTVVLVVLDRGRLPPSHATWTLAEFSQLAIILATSVVGFVIAYRRPGNLLGWVVLASGLSLGIGDFCGSLALNALIVHRWPAPLGLAAQWLAWWTGVLPWGGLGFGLLLFPDGRLPGRAWRPAAWFAAAVYGTLAVSAVMGATRVWSHPFVTLYQMVGPGVSVVMVFAIPATLTIGVAAVIVRFLRSSGEERLQVQWFAAAAALMVITAIPRVLTNAPATIVIFDAAVICLEATVAVAVLKYRLYGIDLVIGRAVLYGCLAAFITAVYAALLVGVGTVAGQELGPLLAATAAAVVAIAFHPVRQRAERLANRVVYGRRATPYQVLSEFAQRIGGAYSTEDVLPQLARVVAAGTGARRVVVWLKVGDQFRAVTSSDGELIEDAMTLEDTAAGGTIGVVDSAGDRLSLPGTDAAVPVMHRGELLGAIAITMPKSERLRPAGEQLVTDVAAQAGLILHDVGLVEELRASRQRLVTAQDEARRRLERNLHDGAQQELVALVIKARLAAQVAPDLAAAREALDELRSDAALALQNLRDLARGIYPPLLADLGLAVALSAQAKKSALPVTVHAEGLGRFAEDAEAAVYFCCLEALQNAAKYAGACSASVTVSAADGALAFTVSDDGAGFDAPRTPLGAGLRNMSDRLAALGGTLTVTSAPGAGTTIAGHIPAAPAPR